MSFNTFDLPAPLLQSLAEMNFKEPTPIQAKAIPVALTGQDVLGLAQTGTGKTAAFGIPIVVRLLKNPRESALILAPTRELATQIHAFMRDLTKHTPHVSCAMVIGGVSMRQQNHAIKARPRVLIATPGRLTDHLSRIPKLLESTAVLVLDEADRMLDMGFAPQLAKIRKFLPRQRQTFLFSATFPQNIRQLSSEYLHKHVEVKTEEAFKPLQKIEQSVLDVTHKDKNSRLMNELDKRQGSVLIFARTKSRTDRLTRFLLDHGYKVAKIHGDCSQAQRQKSIENFRTGKIRMLVATDIASRGIDIPHIAHVINYDLPQVPEDYVHRIGRTGRNGKEGQALALLTQDDHKAWRIIAKLAGASNKHADSDRAPKKDSQQRARGFKPHGPPKKKRFGGHKGPRRPGSETRQPRW